MSSILTLDAGPTFHEFVVSGARITGRLSGPVYHEAATVRLLLIFDVCGGLALFKGGKSRPGFLIHDSHILLTEWNLVTMVSAARVELWDRGRLDEKHGFQYIITLEFRPVGNRR